jgi:hypothetical protein
MKKLFLLLFVAGLLSTGFVSCREKSTVEKVVDDVEDAVD